MGRDKYYCGNCGTALYYGKKFQEHSLSLSCEACGARNPVYFLFCYRCGHAFERDKPTPSLG
jgi:DNA-directed RNA polymerase subunit RPC12/RpoP